MGRQRSGCQRVGYQRTRHQHRALRKPQDIPDGRVLFDSGCGSR
jgi:hypothetical protein